MTLAAGTRLGPYEILSPVGAGGMGEVYKARDTRLDRTVAIKVLSGHLAASPESRQRFEREARAISQLSHPHICALYDVGHEGVTEYLVMEYLEGETLAERLLSGPLPIEQTLRHSVEIAEALERAHRQGIVHRDLKPGNVMLTKSGVKLLDFGLAKAAAPAADSNVTSFPTAGAELTKEGTILGTLQYMAPEQLEGRTTDARTDVFALGAVIYEMATGKKAFTGSSQASLISSIMKEDPAPISRIQPLTPTALDRIVRRCLAKDPDRRWQSAQDVALELEEARGSGEAALPAAARRTGSAFAKTGWIAAAVLLATLAAVLLLPRRSLPVAIAPSLRFTIPPPSGSSIQGMLALSPDGRNLAFVATPAEGRDLLYIRPLDALEAQPLPGTEGATFPFWSPDGQHLAFFAGGKLKRIEANGQAARTLCDAATPRGGSWGSQRTIVFSINSGGQIQRVSENGGEPVTVPPLSSSGAETYRFPSFLPDGRRFLYFRIGDENTVGTYVASLDSPKTSRLIPSVGGAVYAAGHVLYRSGDRLMGQRFDVDGAKLTGEPFPIADHIWWDAIATGRSALSASSNGLIAFQTGGVNLSRLLSFDRSGKELGSLGPDGAYWEPTLSPDGRWLVVPRMDPVKFAGSLWMIDLERQTASPLVSRAPIVATPVWNSDSRRILYSGFGTNAIYGQDARGVGQETLLVDQPVFTPLDHWSPDGRLLFYDVIDFPTSHVDVWVRDLEKKTSRPLLQAAFNQLGARLSPDGRWLAFESDESGEMEIWVRSFPEAGERRQISRGGGQQARWRQDGRELFYVSADRKIMAVEVKTEPRLEASAPRALFSTRILPQIEARNHYDVTPDGQRFVVNSYRPEDAALPITILSGWMPPSQ